MNRTILFSAVITTRNEAENIETCIRAFDAVRDAVEIIVVDNSSTDDTQALARRCGAAVFNQGPERCAQRNRGWREARGAWILILDADMIVPPDLIEELCRHAADPTADAYWIPEVRTGRGLRTAARNFERSFYNGTAIDALRFYRRDVLEATGGYDEKLIAGGEDWELDIRILAHGARCAVLEHPLIHNEKRLSLGRMLAKKAYYSKSIADYRAKWPGHPALRKQFGLYYRYFGVFVENGKWRRILRHPLLAAVMYAERIAVGVTYLLNR